MKAAKRIYDMTDRELRAYKRELRRRKALRRRWMLAGMTAVVTFCLVLIGTLSYHAIKSKASTGQELRFKYYTAVTVQCGDTMWDIAEEYIDYGEYQDKQAYIAEVCSINHMNDDASLRAGQQLIVPYYSSDFVK